MLFSKKKFQERRAKQEILARSRDILQYLTVEIGDRSFKQIDNLQRSREYIFEEFVKYGYQVHEDAYTLSKKEVANIYVEKKGIIHPEKVVIVGAHYDTVEGSPGADDNASAVAALLEVARALADEKMNRTIRFVAFTLEEPPSYGTKHMGSRRFAKMCKKNRENIELMISLEMLGYASSNMVQELPHVNGSAELPRTADFLVAATVPSNSHIAYFWRDLYNEDASKEIYDFIAPASVPGIDLSDHSSFIDEGYPSIMLTDTGFYRNKNYHTETDSIYTINFKFLSENIFNISRTLIRLCNYDGELPTLDK